MSDPDAFVFSLTHETYHPIKESKAYNAVWHHSDYLMYFGSYDFFLEDNCLKKLNMNSQLGHSY